MDDKKDRVRRTIVREMERCMGREGSKLSEARAALKRRYLGCGYGVDEEREARGFSTYVDRTVMETVEWAKPGLMRVFCNDEIIRFDPRTPAEEQAAEDATLYVNQVVFGRNMFRLVHDVLADGLYQRAGWCVAHCPEREETLLQQYAGLSEQEAVALLTNTSLDPGEPGAVRVEQYAVPGGTRYDVSLKRKVKRREIRIDPVPSENVILSADAQDAESARFIAFWEKKTASDLLKEGYARELVESLPPMDEGDIMPETGVGLGVNDEEGGRGAAEGEAVREYKVYEAWFDFDLDGDDTAEKVKAVFCGEGEQCRVLKVEEWPLYRAPLFSACSVPLPHQAVGLCLADLVSDVQDLRTEMTRQYLDCLALGNQGELVVNEGMSGSVEYDSLLARGVGAVHRLKGDATITPLPVVTSAAEALQGLEMSSGLIERRTGVSSRTQSLQADALQNTATGAVIMEEAVNQRLELIARVYAETFFKPLGRYILHLLNRYHDKAVQIRLKGRFMAFDPQSWDPDMDISVAVGLGTGNRSRLVGVYQRILEMQRAFVQQLGAASPVRLSHIVYTCSKMCEAAGLEAPERFFGTEEDARRAEAAMLNAPAQPSAEQQKLQLEQQKAQAKQQADAWKAQTDAQRKAFETQSRIALEKQKLEGQLALKAMEMNLEKELDAEKLRAGKRGAGLTEIKGPGGL